VKEAVIVSTARTPIGKAYRGAFNNTEAPTLASHAIRHAVERAGVAAEEVDDVVMGCAMQQGSSGQNVARQSLLAAGLPVTVPGMTVDRQCSSGMMAIAIAAKQVLEDNMPIVVGGGLESISLVQNEHYNRHRANRMSMGCRASNGRPPLRRPAHSTMKSSPLPQRKVSWTRKRKKSVSTK
jgi:acetyl-CoA C-acetyltransferase